MIADSALSILNVLLPPGLQTFKQNKKRYGMSKSEFQTVASFKDFNVKRTS